MTKDNLAQPTLSNRVVAATRCAHCGRELPSGQGIEVPFIGALGPECVKKYGGLLAALEAANGLEVYRDDADSIRLGHKTIWDLRGAGVDIEVVDVCEGLKAVKVRGLRRTPRHVVKSYEQVRAEFEQRLQLAAQERVEIAKEVAPARPALSPTPVADPADLATPDVSAVAYAPAPHHLLWEIQKRVIPDALLEDLRKGGLPVDVHGAFALPISAAGLAALHQARQNAAAFGVGIRTHRQATQIVVWLVPKRADAQPMGGVA